MILLKLRASFGKLHGELDLREGMNVLCLPNEAGKSTWSAFLLAMLYGIDTSERPSAANQGLPAKERYKPWDGSPMEGSMDLLWEGRAITIQRSTARRIPMGQFRAYETASGTPIPELTAENCGRILCGVERSVFERTAFIRQMGLGVSGDPALEKRLGALVSTGEEGARSASELEKELRNLKNKLNGRAGRIPQYSARLEQLRRTLAGLRSLQEEALDLTARRDAAAAEEARLEALLDRIERARKAQKREALTALEEKYEAQSRLHRRLQDTVAALPDEGTLLSLQRRLDAAEQNLQTARLEEAFAPPLPAAPTPPPCFAGLDAAQAQTKVAEDTATYQKLMAAKPKPCLLPILGGAALLLGGAGLWFLQPIAGIAAAALGLAVLVTGLVLRGRSRAQVRALHERAALIPARCGVGSMEALAELAESYAALEADHLRATADARAQREQLAAAQQTAQGAVDAIVAEIRTFSPTGETVADCRQALNAALRAHAELAAEGRNTENLRLQLQSARQLLGDAPAEVPDAEAMSFDPTRVSYEYKAAGDRRRLLDNRLAECRGAIGARGDPVALEAEMERLTEERSAAEQSLAALELASGALRTADETLRSRFSPQITADTGALLARLTGGKYPSVLLEPDMRLSVREENGTVMRPAAAMSCGAADQMYLALRLAMSRRLLPGDTPLLLDDALVNFDDARTAAALELLREEAKQRQIILFTCRPLSKEKED